MPCVLSFWHVARSGMQTLALISQDWHSIKHGKHEGEWVESEWFTGNSFVGENRSRKESARAASASSGLKLPIGVSLAGFMCGGLRGVICAVSPPSVSHALVPSHHHGLCDFKAAAGCQ